jgi:F420-dependent oxidoreductase-like protein
MTGVGLQIPKFTFPGVPRDQMFTRVRELALAAEDSGYESVWVMDHFYQVPPMGGRRQPMLEAYALLGALAALTSSVRLGALVTGVTYRHPAVLAKQVTTLDVISGGRMVLGLGAAWYQEEHESFGIPFPSLAERFERLEDAVQVCRALFQSTATSPVSFEGRHHRLVDAVNVPPSPQAGGPPIMVGGNSERWALPLVARRADMCNLIGDAPTLRRKLATLDRLCADGGRDPATVVRTNLTTLILADTAAEAEQLRQTFGAPEVIVGTEDEVVSAVQERAALGIDSIICNLPSADPAGVAQVGNLLTKALS